MLLSQDDQGPAKKPVPHCARTMPEQVRKITAQLNSGVQRKG
jgi:hypothetical protein